MLLKRLELSGFKSFADRTELEFVQGITAVVGPNGSGKSNISDGIRWVLGEQSAKSLRGGNMQDVIFVGSDSRTAVNYGEVSLTLDNAEKTLPLDYAEVTVTRRIHRSGESEYFINKQACRLKDITELFMDTGIGKEAYSIIGQGRIEEILSTKSEDRRGIFEEASGIVKYKSRKKESEKKLEETEQNLLRIHDLISEIEMQIEPLKYQAEQAHRYKQYKDELTTNEISLYVHQIEQIHENWTSTTNTLRELEQQKLQFSTIVSSHDAELEQDRWKIGQLEAELEEAQQSLLHISEEHEKCEGYGEVLRERQKHMTKNMEQTTTQIQELQTKLTEREKERDGYIDEFKQSELRITQLREQLAQQEKLLLGYSDSELTEQEEKLKAELLDKLNELAQARNELRYTEQQAEVLGRQTKKTDEEREKWVQQSEQLTEEQHQWENKQRAIAEEINELVRGYDEQVKEIQVSQQTLVQVEQQLRQAEQRLDASVSRKDTLKELQEDFDGFAHGVKEILKARERTGGLQGIHGAIAELITVPAEVERAIETALGGALQHIVVDDEAAGRAAIAHLKKRQLGRATFLPLNVIRGRFIPQQELQRIESESGFVGVAVNLLQYDEKYDSIIASLLGNVVIASTLEQANHIAAKLKYRYRIVTLEGDVVHAGGSMTGGSVQKKSAGLLGRQRQIEQLEDEIKQMSDVVQKWKAQGEQAKKDVQVQTRLLEEIRANGEQKRLDEQHAIAEVNRIQTEIQRVTDQLAIFEQDVQMRQEETEQLTRDQERLQAQIILIEQEQAAIESRIQSAEQTRKVSETEKQQLQANITDLKVNIASAAQENQSMKQQVDRLGTEVDEMKQQFVLRTAQRTQHEQDQDNHEQEQLKQVEQLNDLFIQKEKLTEQIQFDRAKRLQLQNQLQLQENKTKEQREQLKQTEAKLHQVEVQVNRLDVELDHLLHKLTEEYEIGYELAKERYPLPENVEETKTKVRQLKRDITALGDVNLGAIDEFARVNERFEFLSEQRADLTEAKDTLYKVIAEIDAEMSQRFLISFEQIREHFIVVFSKMFGGGRADLILSDPDDLLETGIEIVAQPPGKKLQNLQLLSGGERALTAIALLFAILHYKPVPFCVLDEVEAALDEANVSRFAEYLREFSQETQFIVVTHRKGTMEEADVLYGVTMEEGGVSKLVSVRLDDEGSASA